jgi:hypothetical protein
LPKRLEPLRNKKIDAPLSKIKMPSHAENELKLVEEKIENLKASRNFLEDKKEQLEKSELRFLREFDKELEKLEAKEKYWQGIIEKGISYELTIATGNASIISPKQVLTELLDFDVEATSISLERPSVTLNNTPTEEISNIVPLMKFVAREDPAKALYDTLDDYLDWKSNQTGEAEKNIKFITVVGTSGKGKTTFARRFIDLEYTEMRYSAIVKDCKDTNRRYRVSCSDFDSSRDAETQLSLLVLYEAFKHSIPNETKEYRMLFTNFFENHSNSRISFEKTLQLITSTFWCNSDYPIERRLVIINLDETNSFLNSDERKNYFQELLRILRHASRSFTLLNILSGTHSVDLFEQVKISQSKFVDIELSLIPLEESQQIVLGMTPKAFGISPYLEYILTLCGGVGRYIEILIIQMSIIGSFQRNGTTIKGFKLDCYEHFLENLQTAVHIDTLLEKLTAGVIAFYPNVFNKYEDCIELLSCYTLFQWPVKRKTVISQYSVGDLEKDGLVFLAPDSSISQTYFCVIPFITLYWNIKYSHQNVQIPFLKDIKSYFSPDESENNSLHIMMAKLWGLVQKDKLVADTSGLCAIKLSQLLPLRKSQVDVEIKFRPLFAIMSSTQRITSKNYEKYQDLSFDSECIAFLNAKGASYTDAVIFSTPQIGIQEKQSFEAKKRKLNGFSLSSFDAASFQEERQKFPEDGIFVLIADEKIGNVTLGERDIFIDYGNFEEFSGPLIALRKLYCINELNRPAKKINELNLATKKLKLN